MPSERCGVVIGPCEGAGSARLDYGFASLESARCQMRDASCSRKHANAHRDQRAREESWSTFSVSWLSNVREKGGESAPSLDPRPQARLSLPHVSRYQTLLPWKVPSRANGATPQPPRLNLPPTSCTLSCAFNSTLVFESSASASAETGIDRRTSSGLVTHHIRSSGTPHHKSAAASILQRRA